MKVKYIANSHVSINVTLSNGGRRHITFSPITGGKSVYYTDDIAVQEALECHYRYGRLYKRDMAYNGGVAVVRAARVEKPKSAKKEVKVSDWGSARDYLVSQYGVSRTKVRSQKQIADFASTKGVVFVGV